MKINLRWGPDAFRKLNGVFCVYKPTNMSEGTVKKIIKKNLVRDLNLLPCYEQEMFQFPTTKGSHGNASALMSTSLPCEPSQLSQHRLVLGQRYTEDDIWINHLHSFGYRSSGVLVMGLGKKTALEYFSLMSLAKYLRVYHVKGRLGYSTQNFFPDGHFVERTTYNHISRGKLDKVCASAQAAHQKLIFQCAGVDLQSQEAYELASEGLIRPTSQDTGPLLYSVKCIHFTPPDFTLEVHSINETDDFLANFIHDIGLRLRSSAVCTHVHRLRYGHFGLDHALLKKEWTLEGILKNIDFCHRQLTPNKLLTNISVGDNATQRSARGTSRNVGSSQTRLPGTKGDGYEMGTNHFSHSRGFVNKENNYIKDESERFDNIDVMDVESDIDTGGRSEVGNIGDERKAMDRKRYEADDDVPDTDVLVRELLKRKAR